MSDHSNPEPKDPQASPQAAEKNASAGTLPPGTEKEALAETLPPGTEKEALAETLPPGTEEEALAETLLPGTEKEALAETLPPGTEKEALAKTLPPGLKDTALTDTLAAAPPPLEAMGHMALESTLPAPGSAPRGRSPLAVLMGVEDAALGTQAAQAAQAAQEAQAAQAAQAAQGSAPGATRANTQGTQGSAPGATRTNPHGSGTRGGALADDAEGVEQLVGYAKRYKERAELGRGGLGRVYLAHDRQLGREVAIKELHQGLSSSGAPGGPRRAMGVGEPNSSMSSRSPMEMRFLDEARVTAQLEHPGVTPVYELGQREDGSIYYAMQRIRGRTMAEAIKGKDLAKRLELLPHYLELCQTIAFAHSRGVIHRDLKTDNVMLGDFGETVVLDWGLAKVHGKADRRVDSLAEGIQQLRDGEGMMTLAGHALGTPAYMPPEQARGDLDSIDERSDVYSLGAILYEILTGAPPHRGPNLRAMLDAVLSKDVRPPQEVVPEVPHELAAVALRALARNQADRYPSARELSEDVRQFQVGGLVRAHRYSFWALVRRFLWQNRAAILVGLALIMVASGAWWYRGHSAERSRQRAEAKRQAQTLAEVRHLAEEVARGPRDKNWLELFTFKLISMREPAVEIELSRFLDHREERVRRVAARALGGMKSRRALPALLRRLEPEAERSEPVLADVINALGIIGDPRADRPVDEARFRAGIHGWLWKETSLAYQMIPLARLPPSPSYDQLVNRGRSLVNKERSEEAVAVFDKAVALEPKQTRALMNRAVAWQRLGKLNEALSDHDSALALEPDNQQVRYNRSTIYRQLKRYSEALADLDVVLASGELTVMASRNRARVHAALGNTAQAERDLRQALKKSPKHVASMVSLAHLLREQERLTEATAEVERALGVQPRYLYALSLRFKLKYHDGDLLGALADADAMVAIDPDFLYGYINRARARTARGDFTEAAKDFQEAMRQKKGSWGLLAKRALWLHLERGDLVSANKDLVAAIALAKEEGKGNDTLLEIRRIPLLLRQGRSHEAQRALAELKEPTRPPLGAILGYLRGTGGLEALESSLPPGPFRQHHVRYYQALKAELEGDRAAALAAYSQIPQRWFELDYEELVTTLARVSARDIATKDRGAAP